MIDKQIALLGENIQMCGQLYCTKCKKLDSIGGISDDYEAAEYFKRKGWYSTPNNIYCPTCNKKRKSKLKKQPQP